MGHDWDAELNLTQYTCCSDMARENTSIGHVAKRSKQLF